MSDEFQNWRDALAGKEVALHVDTPRSGYYKMRNGRDGPYQPVAIWMRDGELTCRVAGDYRDPVKVWSWCAKNPVSKDDAKFAFANGSWPGDAPATATVGDNSKHYGEGFDGLQAEVNDYAELCRQFLADAQKAGGIKTKAQADQAGNMADAIGDVKGGLARKADVSRETLTAPHVAAQKEINGQYKPLVDIGKAIAADLRKAAAAWSKAEQARLQAIADAEARKAQAAADAKAKAEREAWEREQAERRFQTPGEVIELDLVPPPPSAPAIVAEKVVVHVGGQRGNKRSLKTRRVAVIEDYAKALAFFAENSDVKAVIQTLAQRAVTAKMPVPGVGVREKETL